MNNIKWIHKNYNYVTTNCLIYCPFFHSYHKFLSVLIRYPVQIRKIVQKVTSLQISFRLYHLEERSAPAAIRYKKCAQIFVASVNKNSIRYTIRDAMNSYTV